MSTPADWPSEIGAEKTAEPGVDFTRAMLGRKWLIILFTGIGLSLAHLQFTRQSPTYASTARILVQRSAMTFPVEGASAGNRAAQDPIATHQYLLTQPVILDGAVEILKSQNVPFAVSNTGAAKLIADGLTAARSVISKDVIELTYVGRDRQDTRKVLDAVIASYQKWLEDTQKSFTGDALKLITEARYKLDQDLKDWQEKYREFQSKSQLLFRNAEGVNLYENRVADIEGSRSRAMVEQQMIDTQLKALEEAVNRGANRQSLLLMASLQNASDAAKGSAAEPIDPFMRQVTPLLLERENLTQQVGESHNQVKLLDAKIAALRKLLKEESGDTTGGSRDLLDVHMDSLREMILQKEKEIETYDTLFEQNQQAAKALAKEQNDERMLRDEGELRKQLFDTVVQRLQQVDLGQNQGLYTASIAQPPQTGVQVGPDLKKYLAGGGAAGFLVALGLSFLLELADKSFRTPDEITRQLNLPVIGHIPELDASRDWKVVKDTIVDRSLATYHRPKSRISEAYRAVRAALYFGTRGQGHRVIQVTSSDPGDGKSTLAANLAVAIASSGKRCLLVDADLRRPRVDSLFGLSNEIGLSSVVQQGMDIPDAIQTTPIPNFEVMTVGPRVDNPAELLLSPRFTELVSMLREQYDFVIIDTPPVLAVTDPAAVAAHVDGVVLVVKITKRSRPHAKRACETLDLIGARVLGVVVNGVGEGSSGYGAAGYGYNYGNPYRYGGTGGGSESEPYFSDAARR